MPIKLFQTIKGFCYVALPILIDEDPLSIKILFCLFDYQLSILLIYNKDWINFEKLLWIKKFILLNRNCESLKNMKVSTASLIFWSICNVYLC